jgi:hypothetical protein
MTADLSTFLDNRLPMHGLAAWCLRSPDGTTSHKSFTVWLSPQQIEQTAARLALAAESLQYQELHPAQVCWIFSHLRLYLALRPDGSFLTLFVENRPDHSHERTKGLLEEFCQTS